MKRVGRWLLLLVIVLLLVGTCVYAGAKYENIQAMKVAKEEETVLTIAIVNLDEGVYIGEEFINYGTSLIKANENNFINTGLVDAREGIKTGKYAAYIIVPATFSESVYSLNISPEKAIFSYELNQKLRKDIREKVIYNIFAFEKNLNNDLGYMYVASILSEFHKAQDDSRIVLENDLKDLEILQQISPLDLVKVIDIGELKRYENDIEDLSVSENYELNEQLIETIQQKYAEYLALGKEEIEPLHMEAQAIVDDNGLTDQIDQMGQFLDESEVLIYESGQEEIKTSLESYNQELAIQKETMSDQLDEIESAYNQEANRQLNQILGVIETTVETETTGETDAAGNPIYETVYVPQTEVVYETTGETDEDGNQVVETSYQPQTVSESSVSRQLEDFKEDVESEVTDKMKNEFVDLYCDPLEGNMETIADDVIGVFDSYVDGVTSETSDSFADPTDMAQYQQMRKHLDLHSLMIEYLKTKTITEVLVDTAADPNHPLNRKAAEYLGITADEFSFSDYYNNHMGDVKNTVNRYSISQFKRELWTFMEEQYDFVNEPAFKTAVQNKVTASVKTTLRNELNDYLTTFFENLQIGAVSYQSYELDFSQHIIDFSTMYFKPEVISLNQMINDLQPINVDDYLQVINEKIISLMSGQTNQENLFLKQLISENKGSISDLMTKYQAYDPSGTVDQAEISGIHGDLSMNNMEIEGKVLEKIAEFMGYAFEAEMTAQENVDGLADKIREENENAKILVEKGLTEAITTKEGNKEINEELLSSFVAKLGYTKLGNGPYAKAYEHIIQPVDVFSDGLTPVKTTVTNQKMKSFRLEDISRETWINIVIGLAILIVLCTIIMQIKKVIREHKEKRMEDR